MSISIRRRFPSRCAHPARRSAGADPYHQMISTVELGVNADLVRARACALPLAHPSKSTQRGPLARDAGLSVLDRNCRHRDTGHKEGHKGLMPVSINEVLVEWPCGPLSLQSQRQHGC